MILIGETGLVKCPEKSSEILVRLPSGQKRLDTCPPSIQTKGACINNLCNFLVGWALAVEFAVDGLKPILPSIRERVLLAFIPPFTKDSTMKKLVLLVAAMSISLGGILRAAEVKRDVVYDGDKIGDNAKGWADPAEKASVAEQDKEVRTAGKTVAFHAKGAGWMGCGWNWFGWYPEDSGTDVSHYKNLRFWAKLTGDKKPVLLSVSLVANETDKDKKSQRGVQPVQVLRRTWRTASGTKS